MIITYLDPWGFREEKDGIRFYISGFRVYKGLGFRGLGYTGIGV